MFFSILDLAGYSSCMPTKLAALETVQLVGAIIALNTIFVFSSSSIISDINLTNKEINQLEEELKRGKEQDS
jgi:Na+/melibiose symporter-like transporter